MLDCDISSGAAPPLCIIEAKLPPPGEWRDGSEAGIDSCRCMSCAEGVGEPSLVDLPGVPGFIPA